MVIVGTCGCAAILARYRTTARITKGDEAQSTTRAGSETASEICDTFNDIFARGARNRARENNDRPRICGVPSGRRARASRMNLICKAAPIISINQGEYPYTSGGRRAISFRSYPSSSLPRRVFDSFFSAAINLPTTFIELTSGN